MPVQITKPAFIVNATTAGFQGGSDVTELADGRIFVTWGSSSNGVNTVFGRFFSASGTALGGEITIVTSSTVGYGTPLTTVLADGRIVVAFDANGLGGGIKAQFLNANGTPSGTIFNIGNSAGAYTFIKDITPLSNGGFVVVGSYTEVFGGFEYTTVAIHSASGALVKQAYAYGNPLGTLDEGDVVQLANGKLLVTWRESETQERFAAANLLKAMIFNVDGTVAKAEWTIGEAGSNDTAALTNGNFVLVWYDYNAGAPLMKGAVYNSSGVQVVSAFNVPTEPKTLGEAVAVVALADGRFAVAWYAAKTIDGVWAGRTYVKVFNADGSVSVDQTLVSTGDRLTSPKIDVEVLANGQLAITWSAMQAATDSNIYTVIVDPDPASPTAGPDNLVGTAGDDVIDGLAGNDIISGLAGNDWLVGGDGADAVNGGDGNDQLTGGRGGDYLAGGNGFDYARYHNATAAVVARLDNSSLNTGDAAGDTYVGIEGLVGSSYNDVLVGNSLVNNLFGMDGNDYLAGVGGNDGLYGGNGNDTADGGAGADNVYGGEGNDNLIGGVGADKLYGGNGFDYASYATATAGVSVRLDYSNAGATGDAAGDLLSSIEGLIGSGFADVLSGDSIANAVLAGNGNDFIAGNGGNDVLYGQAGSDLIEGGAGADRIDGGDGYDYASYLYSATGVVARLDTNSASGGDGQGDIFVSIEALYGSNQADWLYGNSSNNVISSAGGADRILGGGGGDYLVGGGGDDQFYFSPASFAAGTWDYVQDVSQVAGNFDRLSFYGGLTSANIMMMTYGSGTYISTTALNFAGGVFIYGMTAAQLADQISYA